MERKNRASAQGFRGWWCSFLTWLKSIYDYHLLLFQPQQLYLPRRTAPPKACSCMFPFPDPQTPAMCQELFRGWRKKYGQCNTDPTLWSTNHILFCAKPSLCSELMFPWPEWGRGHAKLTAGKKREKHVNSDKTALSAVFQVEEKSHAHSRTLINARKEAKLRNWACSLECVRSHQVERSGQGRTESRE